jgi:hypothetical protein
MRIFLRRALTALVPAIAAGPGLVQADYFTSDGPTGGGTDSYYSQPADETNYLTGKTQDKKPAPPAAAPTAPITAGTCDACDTCDFCCNDFGTWRDNTILSIGGEAYKSIGDTNFGVIPPDFMNSAGFVGTFNTGFRLIEGSPIRGQIGASYGIYDLKGRDTISMSSAEQQTFMTMGVSKRSDILNGDARSWGLVYDQFWAHQWGILAGELYVGQVRGIFGWALSEWNEVGVWGAFRTNGDSSVSDLSTATFRAMNQYNVYWSHNFDFGGQSMLYVGGNDGADIGSWLFGALGQAPLNDSLALYGSFVFDFPGSATGFIGSNEEEWAFTVGLSYFLGGKAVSPSVSGAQGLPLLPVANNGSFLITN